VKQDRLSLYYFIERHAQQKGDQEALWWRTRSYTWEEAYACANQYGHFFLRQGVKPGQLVALFMRNSPDFVFAWIGLWSIGAAPALINISLTGNALLHCVKISGATILLAGGDEDAVARVVRARPDLEGIGVMVLRLDDFRDEIEMSSPVRPPDELRKDIKPMSPFGLFYTR
jgi:acyl-CoA synthetase (AMP-forming)/AMP-acid ligase II